jgi:hypothetical protein
LKGDILKLFLTVQVKEAGLFICSPSGGVIMKKFTSTLCTLSLSAAIGIMPVMSSTAAPMIAAPAMTAPEGLSDVQKVQHRRDWRKKRYDRRNHDRRGYWNGHRGQKHRRSGYRRHSDGLWYPLAAFGLGAIIGGVIANQPQPAPVYRGRGLSNAHIQWCYGKYRSYRASDNTFQPYNGPRQQCRSPY